MTKVAQHSTSQVNGQLCHWNMVAKTAQHSTPQVINTSWSAAEGRKNKSAQCTCDTCDQALD
jgi:hypothetical protein